jgi:ribosomal protein S6--L-glutamate ligase
MTALSIGVIIQRRPASRPSPMVGEMVDLLRQWGCQVDLLLPDEQPMELITLRAGHDLYVLKSGTAAALSTAGALHSQGARIINPYPVAVACRDKVVATRMLQAAGLPVPQTWATALPAELAPLLLDGPLVLKPSDGSEGRGVRVVHEAAELPTDPVTGPPLLAQRYHRPDGRDRKLYCIGCNVFGVLRNWPVRSYQDKLGQPLTVSAQLRDLVLQTGRAFGIDLFGVDVVYSGGEPFVVDVSAFPGFKGVPDAALRLADHIYSVARRGDGPDVAALAGAAGVPGTLAAAGSA